MTRLPFIERLEEQKFVIMDGATGTELQRRGVPLNAPGWSASAIRQAPEVLFEIHRDYVAAGAELLTANTFRTHARNLRGTAWADAPRELTQEAVEIARRAAGEQVYVAGSIAPLEDCYSPHLTPTESELEVEHRRMVRILVESEIDLVLIETQITIREAAIASQACQAFNIPYMISFTCNRDGKLYSGESLEAAIRQVNPFQPAALLVNCLPVDEVQDRFLAMKGVTHDIPLGAYSNSGRLISDGTWESTQGENPAEYAEFASRWKEFGIKLIGGCCGTTPEHIRHLKSLC